MKLPLVLLTSKQKQDVVLDWDGMGWNGMMVNNRGLCVVGELILPLNGVDTGTAQVNFHSAGWQAVAVSVSGDTGSK